MAKYQLTVVAVQLHSVGNDDIKEFFLSLEIPVLLPAVTSVRGGIFNFQYLIT